LVKWLDTPGNMAYQHPGIWVFHTRGFNQSKVVIISNIFKPGIRPHIVFTD